MIDNISQFLAGLEDDLYKEIRTVYTLPNQIFHSKLYNPSLQEKNVTLHANKSDNSMYYFFNE